MTYNPDQPPVPVEDVNRGTVVALLTIPAGIIVWTLIWSIGFIASVVTFGMAILATFLYRLGSGGTIGRAGAVRITIVTLVTVVLSIIAGVVWDVAVTLSRFAKVTPIEALSHPNFGTVFENYFEGNGNLYFSLLVAVAFGVLGCFSVLRGAFKQTEPVQFQAPVQYQAPDTITPPALPNAENPADDKPADPTAR